MNTLKENLEEELALVENYISFLDSRKNGGILFVPENLAVSVYGEDEESFEDVLFDHMVSAIRDPNSLSTVAPIIIYGAQEDFRDQIRHVDLDNDFYATLAARAYKLKAKIAEID